MNFLKDNLYVRFYLIFKWEKFIMREIFLYTLVYFCKFISDAALAHEQWKTRVWVLKPWSSRRVRFWVHRTNLFNPLIHKGLYLNPQAQEHSQNRRTLKGEKAKLSERNNFNCEFKCYTGGPYIGLKK